MFEAVLKRFQRVSTGGGVPRLLAVCFFFSQNFSRDYEETLFSLKENGTRHGRGTDEKKNRLQTLLMFLRIFTPVKII